MDPNSKIDNQGSYQVCDDGRVPGVVLRDPLLHLADEVSAHVSGLGVNAPAQLGEERHKGSAETVTHQQQRYWRKDI